MYVLTRTLFHSLSLHLFLSILSLILFLRHTHTHTHSLSLSLQVNYPLCTIASKPRLPEHCVEYVKILQWPKEKPFGGHWRENL